MFVQILHKIQYKYVQQISQIIAKIEMSNEAIVSNNQKSLPTWFYVRLSLMY
jgi:hypothetical protein